MARSSDDDSSDVAPAISRCADFVGTRKVHRSSSKSPSRGDGDSESDSASSSESHSKSVAKSGSMEDLSAAVADDSEAKPLKKKKRSTTRNSIHLGTTRDRKTKKSVDRASPSSKQHEVLGIINESSEDIGKHNSHAKSQHLEQILSMIQSSDLRGLKAFAHTSADDLALPLNRQKQTALHVAAEAGNEPVISFLLALDTKKVTLDVNARDKNGWSPLLNAAQAGSLQICDILLKYGADPLIKNDQGTTALHYIARTKPPADASASSSSSKSSTKSMKKKVSETVTRGKHSSGSGEHGLNYVNLLSRLAGTNAAGVNARTVNGDTPLINAAQRVNVVAAKWLLANGANWRRRNSHGVTAVTYSEQTLDLGIMEEFVHYMLPEVAKIPTSLTDDSVTRLRLFGTPLADTLALESRQRTHALDEKTLATATSELLSHSHSVPSLGGGDRVRVLTARIGELAKALSSTTFKTIPPLEDASIMAADTEAAVHGVPLVLVALARELRRSGLNKEGLFRVSPDLVELQSLTCRAELFGIEEVLCERPKPVSVASLIKQYYRELPSPLFPSELFSQLTDIGSALDTETRYLQAVSKATKDLREIVHSDTFPKANFALLRFTLDLLDDIASHSDDNKMTTANIAKMLAPALMRPSVESQDIASLVKQSTQTGQLLKFLIENKEKVMKP